ncbi:MAG TPA: hypothetical protein VHC47_13905 [Mucilaginibacter sp.]|nr:hypothetical protein [Mucilaginibacter sp.]
MNEDIILYHLDTGVDKCDIHLRFEGDVLVLDGYDRGALTKQLTGDFDYEYRITVAMPALLLLYDRFGLQTGQRQALIAQIAIEISGANAYTLFRKMLSDTGVAFDSWSA